MSFKLNQLCHRHLFLVIIPTILPKIRRSEQVIKLSYLDMTVELIIILHEQRYKFD